jgi:hypothetical protein
VDAGFPDRLPDRHGDLRGLVFVADTLKGFYISVFDSKGTLLRMIDKNADVKEVPEGDDDRVLRLADGA